MRFPAAVDRPVAIALRALPNVPDLNDTPPRELFARAEVHAVSGVLWDAWKGAGRPVDDALASALEGRALAREMDHEAHLAMLHRIDARLDVPAIALKGPLFAARYYGHPSARGTTDIDLLVAEPDLERAIATAEALGYRVADSAEKIAWSRREHHHVHLVSPHAPDLELHFHAYRGFGITLRTEMLAERSVALDGFGSIRVASAEDELVYLAVHAAAHRFGRLAWLHDLRLVVDTMSPAQLAISAERARDWGVGRALALAGELLVEVLGVAPDRVRPLGALPRSRRALVHAVVHEPRSRLIRAATRFAYTTMLAGSLGASLRYAKASSVGHARRWLGLD